MKGSEPEFLRVKGLDWISISIGSKVHLAAEGAERSGRPGAGGHKLQAPVRLRRHHPDQAQAGRESPSAGIHWSTGRVHSLSG